VAPGRYVKISVIDTGIGMDPEIKQRIFEPFFTTKDMGRGSGMGLASAFGIVKNHGGIIECNSQKGKGTTFNVYLPASYFSVLKTGDENIVLLKGSETVLLVDDESFILKVGRKLLKELGYKVFIANDGKSALKIFKACKENIDLVLLDIIMPDINGEELYYKIKDIKPDVKVLLSSGYSIEQQAHKLIEAGCNGFIQKPFKLKPLSAELRNILDNTLTSF
jgi:CheY-like chemotaxis protein